MVRHSIPSLKFNVYLYCTVGHLECLQTWTEDNRKYVIARRLRNGSPGTGANCFVSGRYLTL